MDLFQSETTSVDNILPYDGAVSYHPQFFDAVTGEAYFQRLYHELDWQRDEIIMFGKQIITKRKVAWYGDDALSYTYSKIERRAKPWTPILAEIKAYVEQSMCISFNSCLCNLYNSGEEGMSWHSDDEPELLQNGTIASLSFGAVRPFQFQHKKDKSKISIALHAGSLLLMSGETQQHWKHQLPVSKKVKYPRINLTFRTIVR